MTVRDRVALLLTLGLSLALSHAGIVPAAQLPALVSCAAAIDAATVDQPGHASAANAAPLYTDPRLAELNWLLSAVPRVQEPAAGVAGGAVASEKINALPPPPSSLMLVLSGLASFGAYQGLRSLKRLHLGHLPDWYHADAVQVGHVTPLHLQFDYSALSVCAFEQPSDLRPHVSYRIPREPCSRLRSQFFLFVESPRAPPWQG